MYFRYVRAFAVAVLIDGIGLAACAWIGLSLLAQLATAAA